jgi:hypothetical protein
MKRLLLCLFFGLVAGCATTHPVIRTKIVKVPVYRYRTIPKEFLAVCPAYKGPIKTDGDLLNGFIHDERSLSVCNLQLMEIRFLENPVNPKKP